MHENELMLDKLQSDEVANHNATQESQPFSFQQKAKVNQPGKVNYINDDELLNAGPMSHQLQSLQNSTQNSAIFGQISFRESKKKNLQKQLSSINSMSLQLSS